jgi:uncharacterized phage protein gp47/JayE
MNDFGMTDRGFIVKPFEEIFKEEQQAFRGAFGNDIDLADDSIEGTYVRNQSLKLSQLWELLGGLYSIGDVDDAFGIYLDRLVNFVNVQRLAANSTRVYECLWMEEGITVLKGHQTRIADGTIFKLVNTITANRFTLLGFQLEIKTVLAYHYYRFTLDKQVVTYLSQPDQDEQMIQAGLAEAIEALFPGMYEFENLGAEGLKVHSNAGIKAFSIANSDGYIGFPLLGAYSEYQCSLTGEITVGIGELNDIVSRVNGLKSCINYAAGITGREMESDTELRLRLSYRAKQATANDVAIENNILKINGVQYVRVYSNRDIVVVDGRPPKSFESVVVGGDDQQIAQAILDSGPAGIEAFGNVVKTVLDDNGTEQSIGFSRPINKYIWLKIVCSENTEELLSANWTTQIVDNIVEWAKTNLDVAADLIYQKLYRPIYDVKGIGHATITVAVTDDLDAPPSEAYVSENVTIEQVEIAVVDASRIEVIEAVELPPDPGEGA